MKQHTSDFKQLIPVMGRQLDDFITYGNTTLKDELFSVTSRFEGGLLKSVMKELDIETSVEIPKGTEINYQLGLLVNDSYEYLNFGNYIVYEVEKSEDKDKFNIKCYDKMLYSMVDYNGTPMTFPISVNDYIKKLAQLINLPFLSDGVQFTNYNRMLATDPYVNTDGNGTGYTIRDIFDELSQVTASNICIGTSNGTEGIEVRYITNTNDTIDEDYLKDVNVTFGEKYGPINSIVLSRAESDNVYLQDAESITQNGLCELKIKDNQIMNFDDRSDYLPGILARLDGLEYYLNDFSSTGICYYDLCDRYNVQIGETTYSCIMFNDEINRSNGLEEIVHTERPKEAETDYTKADKTDRKINKTNLIVDKQNQQITALVTKTDEFDDTLTQLQIDVDGIETKVEGVYNLTRKVSGTKTITLPNCMEGYILEMHIYGNNTVFDQLYPANDLYPSDNLYPYGDSAIVVTDENNNSVTYDLGITEVLRANEEAQDECILSDGRVVVIKRVNADGTTRPIPLTKTIKDYQINVSEGDNTITIRDYTAKINVSYIIKNNYTDQFTTQIQTQSKIEQASNQIMLEVSEQYETQNDANENYSRLTQTANEISTEVSKKVGNNEVISKINQSAEAVTINAGKISLYGKTLNLADNMAIVSNKFNVDSSGNMTCSNATITGGRIYITNDDSTIAINSTSNDTSHAYLYADSTGGGLTIGGYYSNDITLRGGVSPYIKVLGESWADSFNYNSLEELKKNISKYNANALDIITKSDLYLFNYKNENDTDKKHLGFIIGEKYKTPDIILANDGKGINSYSMCSVAWKGIQEQQIQIENQQAQIEELKEEINKLKGEK